jgi:sporulation protein YlmC with PRC-barrel domain
MNTKLLSVVVISLLASTHALAAQPQSTTPDSVVIFVVPDSDTGFSAKKSFLGKAVYSDDNKKIGTITDLIIAPDTSVAYVVIGAGGFVGLGRHNVAVETNALRLDGGKIVLPGATKESLKAAPKLEYPKNRRS